MFYIIKILFFFRWPWLTLASGFSCMSCNQRINRTRKIVWTPWSLDLCLPNFYICLHNPEKCFSPSVNTLVDVTKFIIMGKTYLAKHWLSQEAFQSIRNLFFGEVGGGGAGGLHLWKSNSNRDHLDLSYLTDSESHLSNRNISRIPVSPRNVIF